MFGYWPKVRVKNWPGIERKEEFVLRGIYTIPRKRVVQVEPMHWLVKNYDKVYADLYDPENKRFRSVYLQHVYIPAQKKGRKNG